MTRVSEVMTRDPVTVSPTDTLRHATKMMYQHNVGALPVCDSVRLVGLVTDHDIVTRETSDGVSPLERIDSVANGPAQWCYDDDDIDAVERKMAELQLHEMPVIDHDRRLVGMLCLSDLPARDGVALSSAHDGSTAPHNGVAVSTHDGDIASPRGSPSPAAPVSER